MLQKLIATVQQEQWADAGGSVKAFAKLLGCLPLALDLAANQVRDSLSWADVDAMREVCSQWK